MEPIHDVDDPPVAETVVPTTWVPQTNGVATAHKSFAGGAGGVPTHTLKDDLVVAVALHV